MKFFPLIWAGIWRRRGRTVLTLLSIVNAFLLLGMLNSFTSGLSNVAAETQADSLITHSRISMFEPLPLGLADQIRAVPGVRSVTPLVLFPASYQGQVQGPTGLGVEPGAYFAANPEMKAPPDAVAAMARTRTGAIIGSGLAERYGWKVGDRVPLQSALWINRDGSNTWMIDVVGLYPPTRSTMGNNMLLMNYSYIDEGRVAAKGTASWFGFKIADPSQAAAISAQVDRLFANSSHETKTSTAAQMAQEQITQIGDIGFVVNAVAGAIFFALLFFTGAVMVQSVRERTPELGTLKALGFGDRTVFGMILAEALLVCLAAALVGLALAAVLFPLAANASGLAISAKGVTARGMLLAAGLALLSGLPPAYRAMRLSVVDALAGK